MKPFLISLCLFAFINCANCQEWTEVSSPPQFLTHHSFGFSIDGLGYIVSGSSGNSQDPTNDFFEYDPVTDEWTELNNFPQVRSFGIGDVYDGKAYFGFGRTNFGYKNDLWVFDPAEGDWESLADCPCTERIHPALVAVDGKIYMGLGGDQDGNDLNDWWEYDIVNDAWQEKTSFPGPVRHHPFQFVVDDEVFVGLGHGDDIYNDFYKYDYQTDSWQEMASLPGEARVAGTQFSNQGTGYVLSGEGDDHGPMETGEFWAYDPGTDNWEELTSHPGQSRWAPASFVIDNEVYLINGMVRDFLFGAFEYQDTAYKFSLDASASVADQFGDENTVVYPNPTSDVLVIEGLTALDSTFSLTNSLGQEVNTMISSELSNSTLTCDLSGLENGVYYLKIGSSVHKINKI